MIAVDWLSITVTVKCDSSKFHFSNGSSCQYVNSVPVIFASRCSVVENFAVTPGYSNTPLIGRKFL